MVAQAPTMRPAGFAAHAIARKVNLTARTLAAFRLRPGQAEASLYDLAVPGLQWRLRAPDNAGYFFIRRIGGRLTRVKIGGRELSIPQARRLALAMAGDAAEGKTPKQREAEERKSTATLGDLLARWMEHARLHKRSAGEDEKQIERYLTDWKSRRLVDIDQDAITALHRKVGDGHGKYAANRLLALLSAAYAKAGNLWAGPNPCKGVDRFKEERRVRYLEADELPRFFAALDAADDKTIADAIRFALFTGARRSNVLAAKWGDIDLARATWQIPAESSKNGNVMLIPLSPPAVELLKGRKAESGGGEYVFPGRGGTGHLVDFQTSWEGILQAAGIANLRLHDLRHSLASWMTIGGTSTAIVGGALGHRSQQSTARYQHFSVDPVRAGIDAATVAIMAAANVKQAKPAKRRTARKGMRR